MTQVHLRAEYVRDLPLPDRGQTFYFDIQTQGLGIRVGSRKKTYFAEGRVGSKKRRVTLGSTDNITLNDARKLAKKVLAEMVGGTDPNRVKAEERARAMTLNDALKIYLQDQRLKENTAKENLRLITTDFKDWLEKDVKGISPSMVVRRFEEISDRSPTVANHTFWVLRAVLNYARVVTKTDAGEFTLPPNPCQRLTDLNRWHKSKPRTGRLSADQFPAFFQALEQAKSPIFADFMELLVRAGLRRNEAASLSWADIDMIGKTFTITAEKSKSGKPLTLPMSSQIHELFQRRRASAVEADKVFGEAKRFDPRKSLLRLREGVSATITFHDLRRTFLTVAEEQAVPYGLLKKLTNHSAGNDVTLKHYANTVEHETLRPYMQRISDQIDRLSGLSNESQKIQDQITRLRQVCKSLAEFKVFTNQISSLEDIADEIQRYNLLNKAS